MRMPIEQNGFGRGPKRARPLVRAATIVLLGAALGACANTEMDDLRAYAEQVKARPHGRIEPLPEIRPYETFTYESANLRDPFAPAAFGRPRVAAPGATNGIRPNLDRPREPLEEFPLDSLRMVGTLEKAGVRWALVRTVTGTVHRVKSGQHLGQNYGKITAISEQQVDLTEIIGDGIGGWIERTASLALAE
jgi:type IV pilus assembly protein PilP